MVSPKPPAVFISHTRADSAFATKLAQELDNRGLGVWSADEHLKPGDQWAKIIEEGIHEAENVLVVLSENSADSDWIRAETAMALAEDKKRIVPIFSTKKADVPFILRAFRGVDLSNPEAYSKSMDDLANLLLQEKPPTEFNYEEENRARILKVRLEAMALQQEKISLDDVARLKSRALAISLASVCAAIAVTGTIIAATPIIAVHVLEDFRTPLAATIGTIAGILAGSLVSFLISRAKHGAKAG